MIKTRPGDFSLHLIYFYSTGSLVPGSFVNYYVIYHRSIISYIIYIFCLPCPLQGCLTLKPKNASLLSSRFLPHASSLRPPVKIIASVETSKLLFSLCHLTVNFRLTNPIDCGPQQKLITDYFTSCISMSRSLRLNGPLY